MLLNFDVIRDNLKTLTDSGVIDKSTTKFFNVSNIDNKNRVGELLAFIFDGAVVQYEVRKFLELNGNNEYLLNKTLNDELVSFFENKGFWGIYPYLCDFAKGQYFELNNGEISFRDLSVSPDNVCEIVKKYSGRYNKFHSIIDVNYDAIITKSGDTYLAHTMHDYLIPYMIANSIDLSGSVRISYVPYKERFHGNNFALSSLFSYMNNYTYALPSEMPNDQALSLKRSVIRKICEYILAIYPDTTKEEMLRQFQYSENMGFDFLSKMNKANMLKYYDVAMENLEHIQTIVDDIFPDQECSINLVEMYKSRLRDIHLDIAD